MTEKMFAEIFERKDRIIEQMQEQADSYKQQLASIFLIDGITPPPFLFTPNSNSSSSDLNQLEKDKMISMLLLRPPRDPTRYSVGGSSMYYRPVASRGSERLSSVMCMENHAPNKALNACNEPMVTRGGNEIVCSNHVSEIGENVRSDLNDVGARISNTQAAPDTLECHNNDIVCNINCVAKLDDSVEFPQNETNARIESINTVPDTPLSRIQRSRSRQKARELGTSVKTTAKSFLSNDNRTHISFNGDSNSQKDLLQVTQDKHASKVDNCDDITRSSSIAVKEKADKANNRTSLNVTIAKSSSSHEKTSLENDLTKKGSSFDKENLDGGIMVQPIVDSLQHSGHGVNLPNSCLGSCASKKSRTGKTQHTQSQNKPYCGRNTRSRSSSQQISGISKSSKMGTSVSCNPKEGEGAVTYSVRDLMHRVINFSNKLLDAVETSQVLSDRNRETQTIYSNGGALNPVVSSNMDMKKSSLGDNLQENAEIVVGNRSIDAPVVMQPINSSIHAAPDTLECHNNEMACTLNRVAEFDYSVESPQNEPNARIISIYTAPDMSLARIQRSRSRQKAREIRTNVKTTAKSCLGDENRTHICFSSDTNSKKDLLQVTQDKHPLEVGKHDIITGSTSMTSEEKGDKVNDRTIHSDTLAKKRSPSNKENLDGGIVVQPTGDSLQQYGHGVDLPNFCLGSYASKKSRTRKTQGTQSQTKPYCGRITRSRSSSQQISRTNRSSNIGTSMSCNPNEGGGALSHSVGDFMHKLNVSNKLLDAVETSQVLSDRNGVTFDCCTKVKPKQLNFDEISECDLNDMCSPLSKKRKLGGMLGQECYPSKEYALSIDHKCSSNFLEQQLPKANVLSSSPNSVRIESYNYTNECSKDEMINIGLETNENPVVEDVEHNSMVPLHDDIDVTCEGDLGHKGEESAAGVFMPVSPNSKSSFISSLTKQGNVDFEIEYDSSKPKDVEVGTNLKLSNIKLNSAKFNTCPLNQQKNVEYQPNCFSDSRKFRAPIQSDAIHLNLKAPEIDLNTVKESASILSSEKINFFQSDGIQSCDKSFNNEMICDLPEGTESLHELQAAEETVTEVDDGTTAINNTLKQSELTSVLNMIKTSANVGPVNPIINDDDVATDNNNFETNLPEWMSSYDSVQPSQYDDITMDIDEITPVYEGFLIGQEIGNLNMENNEGGTDFDTLEVPSTTFARASIIEQICKSASMQTPLSQFSSTYKQHKIQNLYGFMADRNHEILDHMDIGTSVSLDEDSRKHLQTSGSCITEHDSVFPHQKISYATPFHWQSKNHYSSPTGKLWERSASSSGSSEKRLSSNPDLTCFPIEEDPSCNEESENAEEVSNEFQENIKVENEISVKVSLKLIPERTENDDEVEDEIHEPLRESTEVWSRHANYVPTKSIKYPDRYSSNSVSIEASVPRTREKVKHKPKVHHAFKASTYEKENRNSSIVTRASSRGNLSEISRNKSSMRSGIPRLSQKEAKRNNIVSNMTSFIPMVQQKQAAAVCTGKRDIKVKALEVAEAAKRREQDKENERKMKKEAMKRERERMEKENAKERVLNLKKKQEELKKKEADIAARKRLREEEERKQVAKKRKLVSAIAGNTKKSENLRQNRNADENSVKKQGTELRTDKTLASVSLQVESVLENCDASNDFDDKEKATSIHEKSPVNVGPGKLTSEENSYDISPYQCSDDEDDEEDDDKPNKKFVPSWASKKRVAMVIPLQQKLDPESIFSADSFCSMDE
ncbi:hypothetical protein M8C21_013696, partial [Ambrosia artemisiifolia]